jgi:PAS domain S-box-containing protein
MRVKDIMSAGTHEQTWLRRQKCSGFHDCGALPVLEADHSRSGFALNPLERISRHIDPIRKGEADAPTREKRPETREFAVVQSKLNLLGEQFRDARQDALQRRRGIEDLIQRLQEAVLLFDVSGRLTMAGDPAERLLGKSRDQMLGRRIEEIFPDSTVLGALIQQAVQRREPVRDRIIASDRDGTGKTRLLLNLEILRNSDHQRMGTLVTLHDAETRRQLELQLDVSSRLAAISRLTGGVAHEIKNPLNSIALHVEVLKSKLEPDDPEVNVILKEIKRLDHIVKTFLSFNQPISIQAKPFDLSQLAEEVIDLIGPEARSKGIEIERQLDDPQWINGDGQILKQAVLNVVMNALDAMNPGGHLVIGTACADSECSLSVSDDGPGIPREIQDKIFNLYFSTKKSGSGIGLAMTFRLVQLHSGSIGFSSEPGKGTSFVLRFPALTASRAPSAVPSRQVRSHTQNVEVTVNRA